MISRRLQPFAVLVSLAFGGVANAQLTTFSGGDVGEGLDLDGTFLWAVHAGNELGSYTARDVTFLPRNTAGFTFAFPAETGFGAPNYGSNANDTAIENVNDFVIYGEPAQFTASGLTIGQQYKLQMLFNEACCNRHFDIVVETVTAGANIYPGGLQGGGPYDQTIGTVFTYTFTAGDAILNVDLNAAVAPGQGSDGNPIFNAFTLEAVPEPASLSFVGLAGFSLVRRRRNA